MKLSIIGAGSTYTPELISGIIENYSKFYFKEISLMDVDEARLQILEALAKRMVEHFKLPIVLTSTLNLKETLMGADFVISQIRVGGLKGRLIDETIPIKYGSIGQETTGAGGFSKALRTIPVMLEIARKIQSLAPQAWLINFTNPSGIITEALKKHSKIKVIGLCNVPIILKDRIAKTLKVLSEEIKLNYFGLNHLSFIQDIFYKNKNVFEEAYLKVKDKFFSLDLIKNLKLIPSPYLRYYFYPEQILKEQKKGKFRAPQVMKIEEELLKIYKDPKLYKKPAILSKRGGALYSKACLEIIEALLSSNAKEVIANYSQQEACADLPYNSVMELPFLINKNKIIPAEKILLPLKIKGLIQLIKSYEELAVQAALEGSYSKALMALTIHPLVGDFQKASKILKKIIKAHKKYLPRFN
ncbi:MAG: 6-phospho-beta-glucosidase [Armatimonadetes bacterium]|nr:6-phospho-beta-glucosidase [Armatimonadota bacterium]